MRLQRLRVVDLRVGRHLDAALLARPILRRRNELRPDSASPMRLRDIPTFDVANRSRPIASVRRRSQPDFNESDDFSARILPNEVDERHNPRRLPRQNGYEFFLVMLDRRIRPQRMPHLSQRFEIARCGRSNLSRGHLSFVSPIQKRRLEADATGEGRLR